jgi:hypothetical protein
VTRISFARGLSLLALLSACHSARPAQVAPAPSCPAGGQAWVREQLYFGRGLPDGGEISDSAWRQFLETEIMPRFQDGLTLVDATGQWRSREGATVRERTWVLVLYHPAVETAEQAVAAVVEAYRRAFAQEAVLRDRDMTCVTL